MKLNRKILRRVLAVIVVDVVVLAVPFLIYFPGRQTPIAFTLVTGIGVSGLQARVDRLEDKAIRGEEFTGPDKRFLQNLYTCFAKGARLTIKLRQSSQLMRHYLAGSGNDLRVAPRIFVKSRPVQEQMRLLKEQVLQEISSSGRMKEAYSSATFYMGDPAFLDSFAGLYFGRLLVRPSKTTGASLMLAWRAELPWEWPTYDSLFKKYGSYHAQNFPLPNARSILLGSRYCLCMDDGLGGHLPRIGLAKPFLAYSEWTEEVKVEEPNKSGRANPPDK